MSMENIPTQSEERFLVQGQAFVIMMLLAFSFVLAWRLLAGTLLPANGFLWLGVCCLCPIVWYSWGFMKAQDQAQSNALLTSAFGWVLITMGFWVHYKKLLDVPAGVPASEVSDPLITILLILGLLVLVIGGWLSWRDINPPPTDSTFTE